MMLLTTGTLPAQTKDDELPELILPEPPATQEGDDQFVEVTVGSLRRALYYYDAFPIAVQYAQSCARIALQEAEEHQITLISLQECEAAKAKWKTATLVSAATSIATITVALLITVAAGN